MRIAILLFEVDHVLSEDVVVHTVEVNSVSYILELICYSVERVALLYEVLHITSSFAKSFQG